MKEIINKIISCNSKIFGNNIVINKINSGFTNTIYTVNDKYVIKICSNINNEDKFKKEINFYNSNKKNNLIPKLYLSSIDKKEIPYMYIILEKLVGVPLFNVWHTFKEDERKNVIKQLCEAMKIFHNNTCEKYNWSQKTCELFLNLFDKAKSSNLFTMEEQELIIKAYLKFNDYLKSDDFVLVHNDLHFDNIIYNKGKIKLIDFERSLYAPRDFELDIIYRMIRKPWKFASEDTEKYTKLSDYKNIMNYIEIYYPEIIHIDNLYKRLAIYDIVYYLKQYIVYSKSEELKNDILNAAKNVIGKD